MLQPAWCQSSESFCYFNHPAGQLNKQIEKILVCFPSLGAEFESINGQTGKKMATLPITNIRQMNNAERHWQASI